MEELRIAAEKLAEERRLAREQALEWSKEVKMESERQTRMTDAESQTMALNPQTIAIFLRVLRNK